MIDETSYEKSEYYLQSLSNYLSSLIRQNKDAKTLIINNHNHHNHHVNNQKHLGEENLIEFNLV